MAIDSDTVFRGLQNFEASLGICFAVEMSRVAECSFSTEIVKFLENAF